MVQQLDGVVRQVFRPDRLLRLGLDDRSRRDLGAGEDGERDGLLGREVERERDRVRQSARREDGHRRGREVWEEAGEGGRRERSVYASNVLP